MLPLIGITCGHDSQEDRVFLNQFYARGILEAGGLPVLLPVLASPRAVEEYAGRLQGLLLSGGGDVAPSCFGEEPLAGSGEITPERDEQELELVRRLVAAGKPCLGICRGCQVLNIALGGTIYQDLPSQVPGALKHMQQAPRWYATHSVQVFPGTRLHGFYSNLEKVNSFHHQAVKDVAPGLVVSARARDGVIEAIEAREGFLVGLQWHPEAMWQRDRSHLRPFRALVEAAGAEGK